MVTHKLFETRHNPYWPCRTHETRASLTYGKTRLKGDQLHSRATLLLHTVGDGVGHCGWVQAASNQAITLELLCGASSAAMSLGFTYCHMDSHTRIPRARFILLFPDICRNRGIETST